MKSLIKQGVLLLLVLGALCVHGVIAADTEPDVLTRARVFIDAGRLKDAVAVLKGHEPRDAKEEQQITLLMGKIYLAIDRPAKALEYFRSADEQISFNMDAVIGAANASLKLGQFAEARKYAIDAGKLNLDSPEPELLLALIEQRSGQTSDANRRMENLLRKRPGSASHVVAYAKYLLSAGEQAKAVSTLQSYRESHPTSAPVLEQLGDLEFSFGNKSTAFNLKRDAAKSYASQGNEYRVRVIQAWVEENSAALDPPKRDSETNKRVSPAPSPEAAPDLAPNGPPQTAEKKDRFPETADQKPKLAKFTDPDVNLPVQRFPFPKGVTITGGSGFIVDEGRKIVTNKHVIEGGKEFAIRTGLGEVIRAKVVFISDTDDLAVLELSKPLPPDRAIPSAAYAKPRVGRDVVVMGYPLWYILGEGSPSLTNGVVSKGTGMGDDRNTFQLTAKVNKGNSGGPVFDLNGNVVGITVGKLDSQKINQEQGFVPEDINFAIHVDRLPPMAKVALKAEGISDKPVSPETLYQLMLGRVVMVATYK